MKNLSLVTKFLAICVIVILISYSLSSWFNYKKQEKEIIEREQVKLIDMVKSAEEFESSLMNRQESRMAFLCNILPRMDSVEDMEKSIIEFLAQDYFYESLIFLDKNGGIVDSYPNHNEIKLYQNTYKLGGNSKLKISEVIEQGKRLFFYLLIPYGEKGEIALKIDREKFSERFLSKIKLGETSFYAAASNEIKSSDAKKGKFFFHSNPKLRGLSFSDLENGIEMLSGKKDGIHFYNLNGHSKIAAIIFSKTLPSVYGGSIDLNKLLEPAIETRNNAIISALITILITIVVIVYFGKVLLRDPLNNFKEKFKEISSGNADFTKELPIRGKDEIGKLSFYFNTFQKNMGGLFVVIAQKANELICMVVDLRSLGSKLDNISNEFADVVGDLSEDMGKITESINHSSEKVEDLQNNVAKAAAAVEEMGITINSITQNAMETNGITKETELGAAKVSKSIEQLVCDMAGINMITRVVSDIADQINVIAINATIEAARAGEAGKCFAVIANEIRELSKRTNDELGKISDQTEKIQESAGLTTEDVFSIISQIAKISTLVGGMTESLEQQSIATKEINESVARINESATCTSTELLDNNEKLQEMSVHFGGLKTAFGHIAELSGKVNNHSTTLGELGDGLRQQIGIFAISGNNMNVADNTMIIEQAA